MTRFLLIFALLAAPLGAQTLPAKPQNVVDASYVLASLAVIGSTVADAQNSLYALKHDPYAYELDPLFGKHPTALRYYAIGLPIDAATLWLMHRWKKQDQQDIAGGYKRAWVRWYYPAIIVTATHGVGIAVTLGNTKM